MNKLAAALAAILTTGTILASPANATHPQATTQASCPIGAPCPGDPTCVVYPKGDCHNSGKNAALELFGCTYDFEGNKHFAIAGLTGRGAVTIHFRVPVDGIHSEFIAGKENKYIEWSNGQSETANRVYVTESASTRLQTAWLLCCACDTPGEARAAYRVHIVPLIRAARGY